MDIEKYTNGKVYTAFEWIFKLILWNLLLVLIVVTITALPFYGFYTVQENNLIDKVEIIDNDIAVTQKNDRHTLLEDIYNVETYELEKFVFLSEKTHNLKVLLKNGIILTYTIEGEIDKVEIVNGNVYAYNKDELKLSDEIYQLDYCEFTINRDRHFILSFDENNKQIDFGIVVETQNGLASIFLVITIVLAVFAFVPTFVTVFSMIKIFGEHEGSTGILVFFDRLWDNFKALYKLELIMIPIICLFTFATYFYYVNIINSKTMSTSFESLYVIGYNFLLVSLIIIVLCLLNLPMSLGYFRMRTKTIMKFTFIMTFKNILYTFIYLFSFLMPLLLCLMNPIFIPIWFLCGISIPLYLCYSLSRSKYRYLVKNLEEINTELKDNTDIYKFTDKERGEE